MRFYTKSGAFQKFQTKRVFSQILIIICESVFFEQICYFFIKKSKTLGSLCDKLVTFDQKNHCTWDLLGDRANFFRGIWAKCEQKKRIFSTLYTVPWNMGLPLGSDHIKIWISLNIYKWYRLLQHLLVDKCIKEQPEFPNRSGNSRHSAKALNSDFYMFLRSKPHIQNSLIDLKDFLTQTAQVKKLKSKIKSWIWRTRLDMVAGSLVLVLSGTHYSI